MRTAEIIRKTNETDIALTLALDGSGKSEISTGSGFMDHMLELFAAHGKFDLKVECTGDVEVDYHHSIEDIGICLGMAFKEALGDKVGIARYGDTTLAMDEALILTAVDLSGRSCLMFGLNIPNPTVGAFDTELVEEFWNAFVRHAECAVHFHQFSGVNTHHIIEGAFKSVARSLRKAVALDADFADQLPSTKGTL